MIKFSIFLVLLVAVLNFGQIDAKLGDKCPPSRSKGADKCSRDVFFLMDPNFKAPKNKEEMLAQCAKIKENIACIEKYGKDCLTGFTASSLKTGMKGFKNLQKSLCDGKAPKQKEFIERTQWIGKNEADDLYTCAGGAISNFKYINDEVKDSTKQIPLGCCNYHVTRECMEKKMKKMRGPEDQKFFKDLTDDTMTNMIKFLCTKQDSMASCKTQMPADVERMAKTVKNYEKGKREEEESFLLPFLKIISD